MVNVLICFREIFLRVKVQKAMYMYTVVVHIAEIKDLLHIYTLSKLKILTSCLNCLYN